MTHEYTANELAGKINLSSKSIRERMNLPEESARKFRTITKKVGNHYIKHVLLSDKEFQDLINEYGLRHGGTPSEKVIEVKPIKPETFNYPEKQGFSYEEIINKILDFTQNRDAQLSELHEKVTNEKVKVAELETKVKFLEAENERLKTVKKKSWLNWFFTE